MEICFCPPYFFVAIDAHGNKDRERHDHLLLSLARAAPLSHLSFKFILGQREILGIWIEVFRSSWLISILFFISTMCFQLSLATLQKYTLYFVFNLP